MDSKEPSSVSEFSFLERMIRERESNHEARFKAIERLIDERDRLYTTQFASASESVKTALAAQEKSANAASSASEKAILKSEQAQKEYNERSNEFRGQLDDQAKTLMPRPETLSMFKALEEKITGGMNVMESKIANVQINSKNELETAINNIEKTLKSTQVEVSVLRDYRSEGGGKDLARQAFGQQHNYTMGLIVAIGLGLLGFMASMYGVFFGNNKSPAQPPQVIYATPPTATTPAPK